MRRIKRYLAGKIRRYLASLSRGDSVGEQESSWQICAALTRLLSHHLELSSPWPHKQRWLDGLIDAQVCAQPANIILVYGEMVWGLSANPGGNQWGEPFEAVIKISKKPQIDTYRMKFGNDKASTEKMIRFGFYTTLSAKTETELTEREYSYQFGKSAGV